MNDPGFDLDNALRALAGMLGEGDVDMSPSQLAWRHISEHTRQACRAKPCEKLGAAHAALEIATYRGQLNAASGIIDFANELECLHECLVTQRPAFQAALAAFQQDVLRDSRPTNAHASTMAGQKFAPKRTTANSLLLRRCQLLVQVVERLENDTGAIPQELRSLLLSDPLPKERAKQGRPPEHLKNAVARYLHEHGTSDEQIADVLGVRSLAGWENRVRNACRAKHDRRTFEPLEPTSKEANGTRLKPGKK